MRNRGEDLEGWRKLLIYRREESRMYNYSLETLWLDIDSWPKEKKRKESGHQEPRWSHFKRIISVQIKFFWQKYDRNTRLIINLTPSPPISLGIVFLNFSKSIDKLFYLVLVNKIKEKKKRQMLEQLIRKIIDQGALFKGSRLMK